MSTISIDSGFMTIRSSQRTAHREAIRDYFAYSKAIVQFWFGNRHGMSQEFVEEIDGLLTTYNCSNI
jgi:hypothetical protein